MGKKVDSRYSSVENLGKRFRVLPHVIDLRVPGFAAMDRYNLRSFAPEPVQSCEWFNAFCSRVVSEVGKSFLPVFRMADGEYLFNLGFQPPSPRVGFAYPRRYLQYLVARYRPRRRLIAGGSHAGKPLYGSADYSSVEVKAIRRKYIMVCKRVAEAGFLALDLSFCEIPFQENYFPALRRWLDRHSIRVTIKNYVPFYFVYALLAGPERHRILSGRRVLVIHSAVGQKQEAIKQSLIREGATAVHTHVISATRSFFDAIPVEQYVGRVDLCVFGAGIGKAAVLDQLERLGVPCIDAGYVLEVWADSTVAKSRIFTQPDESATTAVGAEAK